MTHLPGTHLSWLDKEIAKTEAEWFSFELDEAYKLGRYPFHIAAKLIAQVSGFGISTAKMEERLTLAAQDGSLPVYGCGSTIRWDGDIPYMGILEIYFDDLNNWLKINEPRIEYIFQERSKPSTEKIKVLKGITKQEVIAAFEGLHFVTSGKWSKALADVPKWLVDCRIMKGSKKASALWNPVLIAISLLDKNVPMKKLDAVFIRLRDWREEWEEASSYSRS